MAKIIIKNSDTKTNTPVGLKIPFSSPGVFSVVFSTKEQLKYNLINLVLTEKGERIENPNFGTNIRKFLFENYSDNIKDRITEDIIASVNLYLPEVIIDNININEKNIEYNSLNIEIIYRIKNLNSTDTLNIEIG